MAKRYRYAFAKKKESPLGKLSMGLLIASLLCLLAGILVSAYLQGNGGVITGGFGLLGFCLACYGFLQGMKSFSDTYAHKYSVAGSIANGLFVLVWLCLFLAGAAA